MIEKPSKIWRKFFVRLVKTAFDVSRGKLRISLKIITVIYNYFPHFWTLSAKNYPTFGGKISANLAKMHFTCPEERLRFFSEKVTLFLITLGI